MVTTSSEVYRDHPDWILRNEKGCPIPIGITWSGRTYALDSAHPAVLEWLEKLICKVRGWGYGYLKLDFLYAGAFPGKHHNHTPREQAYRQALEVIRSAAGEAYILACGAPIIPSLGLCDGMRVGPDVAPYWINTPMSIWLNNPNHPSAQNAIRTSLHRLWLQPLVHTDPDVVYFRSRHNALTPEQNACLHDLGLISCFKATSDLPDWLKPSERETLREFLASDPKIERLGRYRFRIDDRTVDFTPVMPLPGPKKIPARLATALGLYDMAIYEVLPALLETERLHLIKK
jgi:alpha-galactosidase